VLIFFSSLLIFFLTCTDCFKIVPKRLRPGVIDSVLSTQVLNIMSLCIVAIVLFAHFVWIFERVENPEQFPPDYLAGIDDAIWWSCTTVTTVGYGDKFPITNAGRLFALVWQFSGVVFLGLFAGAVSSSMAESVRATGNYESIMQLPRTTTNICTPSTYYGARYLDKHNLQHYHGKRDVAGCVDDLKNGIATAVMYDTKDLRFQFKTAPEMLLSYSIIPGETTEILAPALSKAALIDPLVGNAFNSALSELKEETFFYKDLLDLYFPSPQHLLSDSIESSGEDKEQVNWILAGPALSFILAYWGMCTLSSVRDGEWDYWILIFCNAAVKKEVSKAAESTSKQQSSEVTLSTLKLPDSDATANVSSSKTGSQADDVHVKVDIINSFKKFKRAQRRKMSYQNRDMMLHTNTERVAHHKAGHNRALFLDSKEFVGLQTETHSVHRLLLEQAESIEALVTMQKLLMTEKTIAVESFATQDTSEDEDEDEDEERKEKETGEEESKH
jgi:hypothetical protein